MLGMAVKLSSAMLRAPNIDVNHHRDEGNVAIDCRLLQCLFRYGHLCFWMTIQHACLLIWYDDGIPKKQAGRKIPSGKGGEPVCVHAIHFKSSQTRP